jgi:transcriptional regulator with XRE-family HTH domain
MLKYVEVKNIHRQTIMEYVAKRLIEAREKRNWELLDVVIMSQKRVTKSTLSRMENAKYPINIFLLMELAMLYNKPINFFLPPLVFHKDLRNIIENNKSN